MTDTTGGADWDDNSWHGLSRQRPTHLKVCGAAASKTFPARLTTLDGSFP